MSDFYVSVIPTDVNWQPTNQAAAEAEAYVQRAFPDPDGMQQKITVEFHDRITVIDAGENLQRITCPRCGHNIPLDWYQELVERTEGDFDDLDMTVPCCHTVIALDALQLALRVRPLRDRGRQPVPRRPGAHPGGAQRRRGHPRPPSPPDPRPHLIHDRR